MIDDEKWLADTCNLYKNNILKLDDLLQYFLDVFIHYIHKKNKPNFKLHYDILQEFSLDYNHYTRGCHLYKLPFIRTMISHKIIYYRGYKL